MTTLSIAQEPVDDGFPRIRIANATGLDGQVQVFIQGESINPDGFKSGEVTGVFALQPGTIKIDIKHPQIEDTTQSFTLNTTDRLAIIAYTEPKKEEEAAINTKRVLKFTTLQRKQRGLKKSATLLFLSVSEGLDLGMNKTLLSLTPHKQVDMTFEDSRGSQVALTVKDKSLKIFDIDEPGDYAVIIYDMPNDGLGCITFNNTKR